MNRKTFISSTIGTLAAAGLTGNRAQTQSRNQTRRSKPDDRPNILWICTDQQRWDTIQSLGNPHIRTPHLDALAAEGMAFTHAYCQNPICTPSRASFLTGKYPRSIDACKNGNDNWQDEAPLVTKLFADAGYGCGLAGKFHLTAAHNRIEKRLDDGYRVFHWSHHPKDSWPEGHAYNDWLKSQGVDYTSTHKKHGSIPAKFHQTTWCADRAIEFMNEPREGPWLFSFNCYDPHPPLDPPKEYLDRFAPDTLPVPAFAEQDLEEEKQLSEIMFQSTAKRVDEKDARLDLAKYWAMIELIDDQVGRMLEALEKSGQRENTVVIFTSDHGHMIGDHGLYNKGCRFYEGLVRVPLIWSWPKHFPASPASDALVELVDIAPTLMELAGLPIPDYMHGRSLLPILKGDATRNDHRDFVRSTYSETLDGPSSFGTMIRDRRYKLVNYHGTGKGQLFDLSKDPNEHRNLWSDPSLTGVKLELMQASFDVEALTTDTGSTRSGRY